MNRSKWSFVLALILGVLLATGCGGGGGGGTSTATVTGNITFGVDQEANTAIELFSLSTGAVYNTITDTQGQFNITGVVPGRYAIRYYHQGLPPYDNFYCESLPQDVKLNQTNEFNLHTEPLPELPE